MVLLTALLGVIFTALILLRKKRTPVDKKENAFPIFSRFEVLWSMLINYCLGRSAFKFKDFRNQQHPQGVIAMKVGTKVAAFINDFQVAKETMKSADWQNRLPADHYINAPTSGKPLGLFFGGGEFYKSTHRIVQRSLSRIDFFNPQKMQTIIGIEMEEFFNHVEKQLSACGNLISFEHMFQPSTVNIVWQLMFSTRFDYKDPILKRIVDDSNEGNALFGVRTWLVDIFPAISSFYKPPFVRKLDETTRFLSEIFQAIIDEKKHDMSDHHEPRDFTDGFLLEIAKQEGTNSTTSDSTLKIILRDFIFAGVDTTNTSLEFTFLYLITNPRVYNKVLAEIDEVVGKSRLPSIDDRNKMIYTQATLLEVLRMSSVVSNITRTNEQGGFLNGLEMPVQSLVTVKVYRAHHSQDVWEDPKVFRPERFIGPDGGLVNQTNIFPFGLGKRACIGEPLARAIMFLYTVTMLQKFSFEIPSELPPPSFKTRQGLSRAPQRFFVRVTERL